MAEIIKSNTVQEGWEFRILIKCRGEMLQPKRVSWYVIPQMESYILSHGRWKFLSTQTCTLKFTIPNSTKVEATPQSTFMVSR